MLLRLLLLLLDRVLDLSASRRFRSGVWTYNAGVLVTVAMQALIGTRTVFGHAGDSAALAGISGTGHIVLTTGLVLVFVALGRAVRTPVGPRPVPVTVGG